RVAPEEKEGLFRQRRTFAFFGSLGGVVTDQAGASAPTWAASTQQNVTAQAFDRLSLRWQA
ncbi:MAG TPA: hypothetical protein VEU53_10805, partial [Stellaceae bacterium]|nr:hypothetical protein [Stellaceae bacterium]